MGKLLRIEVYQDSEEEWAFAPVTLEPVDGEMVEVRGEPEDLSQYGPYALDAVQAMAGAKATAAGVDVVTIEE